MVHKLVSTSGSSPICPDKYTVLSMTTAWLEYVDIEQFDTEDYIRF